MPKKDDLAFCKAFPDSSHLPILWNPRDGVHFETPDDLWNLPHDMAGNFLRRLAEGRPTPEDREIMQDCADIVRMAVKQ